MTLEIGLEWKQVSWEDCFSICDVQGGQTLAPILGSDFLFLMLTSLLVLQVQVPG